MKRLFILWFEKIFSNCFMSYPQEHLPDLYNYYNTVFQQLKADVFAKYPSVVLSKESDNTLFDIIQSDPTIEAILYYRIEREMFLNNMQHELLPFLASAMIHRTGMEIYYSTDIGPGFNIQHGVGIVIGPRHKIGKNFCIYQGVTVGQRQMNSPHEKAQIGDNVTAFSGSKILGNIIIGNNVKIGANAVLLCNADMNATYVGIPAKKI